MAVSAGPIILGGLIAWGLYRRMRRNIGRQPLRKGRLIFRLLMLVLVTFMMVFLSAAFPKVLAGFSAGLAIGAIAGIFGLRLTKFDTTDEGHFYTPNTVIGVTLSVLLMGRILYRWMMHGIGVTSGQPQLLQSPLTLFVLGLNLGYFLVYNIGLLLHTYDQKPGKGTTLG